MFDSFLSYIKECAIWIVIILTISNIWEFYHDLVGSTSDFETSIAGNSVPVVVSVIIGVGIYRLLKRKS